METLLVGYGTLLYRKSMGRTVGQEAAAEKEMMPVVVHGYRRLCNLRPTHYQPSLRLSPEPLEAGALNVEPADGASFNGVAFRVTADELAALDERERYYLRRTAPVYAFGTNELLGEAAFYGSDPDAEWIERDPAKLLPRWEDVIWTRAGAYAISRDFGRYLDATTFLADGCTLLIDRYRDALREAGELDPAHSADGAND